MTTLYNVFIDTYYDSFTVTVSATDEYNAINNAVNLLGLEDDDIYLAWANVL